MGLKWSRSMNMMRSQITSMVRAERFALKAQRFLIKHNMLEPTSGNDEEEIKDGWIVKQSLSETRFIRRYASQCEKRAKGAGDVVFEMLKDALLVSPTMEPETNGIIIRCKTNKIRNFAGFKVNFWIKITDEGNQIRVEYFVPFNEAVEMQLGIFKAISGKPISVANGGVNMIASVMRAEIPMKIDDVIKKYLNT